MAIIGSIYRVIKHLLVKLIEPLTVDETITQFTLSIPEAQTTTVDSVQGWANRPPAVFQCSGCESEIYQQHAMNTIDCPACWREFPNDAFSVRELRAMICPRCNSEMNHGRRHPNVYDTPEWATCPNCQYHWDLDHWF